MKKEVAQVPQKEPSAFSSIKKKVMRCVYDCALKVLSPQVEKIINGIKPVYPANYAQRLREGYSANHLLMTIANHQTHADGFPLAKLADDATRMINENPLSTRPFYGFRITAAASVKDGKQSEYITSAFNRVAPLLKGFSLFPKLYIRKGTVDGKGFSADTLKDILRANRDGYAVAALPEGTVQGGRTTNGVQDGIQEVGVRNLALVIKAVDRLARPDKNEVDRKVMYLPASFEGTTLLYHPDKKHPAIKELIGFLRPGTLAGRLRVVVHEPITSDQLRKLAADNNISNEDYPLFAAKYLYGQIASELSQEPQGNYGRKVFKYKQLADQHLLKTG